MNIGNSRKTHVDNNQIPEFDPTALDFHTRSLILDYAQVFGVHTENMTEDQILEVLKKFGQLRVSCSDPGNYPSEALDTFEGMITVPAYLMFDKFERDSERQEGDSAQ